MVTVDIDDLRRRMEDHDVIGGSAVVILTAVEVHAIIEEMVQARSHINYLLCDSGCDESGEYVYESARRAEKWMEYRDG